MTSLGYLQYSEINDNSAINSNATELEKKKLARHNITIKKRHDPHGNGVSGSGLNSSANNSNENVQNMLKLINNSNGYENDMEDSSGLADFNPPPRAEVSIKSENPNGQNAQNETIDPTSMPIVKDLRYKKELQIDYEKPLTITRENRPAMDENITAAKPRTYPAPLDSYEGFALPKTYASDYYKQYVPYFNQTGSGSGGDNLNTNKSQILEKLNHMIHLLEEQRDEKTGHVMEEIILYSFLGVFIIFIVDSFARVGKYTR
jgi:hypothetical protein